MLLTSKGKQRNTKLRFFIFFLLQRFCCSFLSSMEDLKLCLIDILGAINSFMITKCMYVCRCVPKQRPLCSALPDGSSSLSLLSLFLPPSLPSCLIQFISAPLSLMMPITPNLFLVFILTKHILPLQGGREFYNSQRVPS